MTLIKIDTQPIMWYNIDTAGARLHKTNSFQIAGLTGGKAKVMREDARKIEYETLELLGQTVLFTCLRIDRATVPDGLHAYDVRHDDDCTGIMCEIAPHVLVNHWGTVLCREPIELTDNGRRYITEDDYSYLGEEVSLNEYMAAEPEKECVQ